MPRQNVVVTGAAGGMGSAALELLARRDVNVVCVDLDQAKVESTIAGLGEIRGEMVAVGADVSSPEMVDAYNQSRGGPMGWPRRPLQRSRHRG
jgi:NAD(P)-dependent dehydrogenase (short-subunit alcohol dehydrogenase family)